MCKICNRFMVNVILRFNIPLVITMRIRSLNFVRELCGCCFFTSDDNTTDPIDNDNDNNNNNDDCDTVAILV